MRLSRLDVYIDFIKSFVNGSISANTFEQIYLTLFKNEQTEWTEKEYQILDELFSDVDAYCPDASIRGKDDLDEKQLLEKAKVAVEKLLKINTPQLDTHKLTKSRKIKKGNIDYNGNWKLNNKNKMALLRLAELGVDISSSIGEDNYTLLVPHELEAANYIEIGYLISQLVDEEFPAGYDVLSTDSSDAIKKIDKDNVLIEFVDSYPHGLKYRVNLKNK